MSKNLLHAKKYHLFLEWMDKYRIEHRKGSEQYQLRQVKLGDHWLNIYSRPETTEHYITDQRLTPLIRQFIREYQDRKPNVPIHTEN